MRFRLRLSLLVSFVIAACARQPSPTVAPVTTIAAAPDRFAVLGAVRLRYRDLGAGPPVVLLHGFAQRLEDWSGLGDSIAQDHRVVTLDLRGFGQSTKFSRESDFGIQIGDDVIRLLDYLHIPRAHLVGKSLGAAIAANIAARYPNRVASATLVAFFGVDSATVMRTMAAVVSDLDAGRGLTGELKLAEPGMDSATAQTISRRLMAANDSSSLRGVLLSLATLTVYLDRPPQLPVLIVAGGDDPLNPASRALASRWPNARLLELPRASHGNVVFGTRPEVLEGIRQITRVP